MEGIDISKYLQEFDSAKRSGKCIACHKIVQWCRERLAAHKRSSCPNFSEEEKRFFAKRKLEPSTSHFNAEMNSESSNIAPDKEMSNEKKAKIDTKLASFFFRTGISLRILDSEVFKDFVKTLDPSYASKMPCSKSLSGPLLDETYMKCKSALDETLDSSNNLTLISDGWTNIRGDHIVNFCVKAPEKKPFFYTSIDTSGIAQNAVAVCSAIADVIDKLGPRKFCNLITDNAPVMQSARKLIEERFPHISTNGCAAHGVNLLIKDIVSTPESIKTIKEAEKIIKFIKNHHLVKAKFEERRIAANVSRSLSMSVSTRWMSLYNSLNDLYALKYVIIQLADEEGDFMKEIQPKTNSATILILIKDNSFWSNLNKIVKNIELPTKVIGKLESDSASLSLVYHYFGKMFKEFEHDKVLQQKVKKRFDFLNSPTVGLAYMLTPKFAATGIYFDEDRVDIISTVQNLACSTYPELADQIQRELISFVSEMSSLTEKRK